MSDRQTGTDRPSDCVLLVAVPLTRDAFLSDLLSKGVKDYAISIKAARERANESIRKYATPESHWKCYEPVAQLIEWHCREAEKLGAGVVRNATLTDFEEALLSYRVVTLASHWKFTLLHEEDVTDPAGFVRLLRRPETPGQEAWSRRLRICDHELLHPEVNIQNLVKAINRELDEAHSFYRFNPYIDPRSQAAGKNMTSSDALDRLTKTRLELDFADCITPLRAVEFFDRMYSVPEILDRVPASFTGVLDLTVCNSVVLGQALKMVGRKYTIGVSRYRVEPVPRFRTYLAAIRSLSRSPGSYIEAVTALYIKKESIGWHH